jgi:two-component system, OmpR family, sensor histidine kinase BaeS
MRFGITSKLFATILITNVMIAVATGAAMQISVNSGLHNYVEEREFRRLQQLAAVFAFAYAQHPDWSFVRDHDDEWQRLRTSDRPPRPRSEQELPITGVELPPRPLTLLDSQHQLVRGNTLHPPGPALSAPIIVGGTSVGWVAVQDLPLGEADEQLLQQQLKMSWIVGSVALVLGAAVSFLLARGFLAPIRRLARATRRLTVGDYAQRIHVSRGDELGQLVDDFNALAATLEHAETARRSFLADVAHELRTPLAILRGELEALQEGVRSLTPETVKSLQAEVGALTALVEDLRELSAADVGSVVYDHQELDLGDLARTALCAFRDRFAEHGLAVDAAGIPRHRIAIVGDSRRLMQLFNNLFENTLRYTDPGGRVKIGLKRTGKSAELEIEDSAPGVPAQLLPRLFERLFRVENSRNRALGGVGLGLALCRSIVGVHKGDIEASASSIGGLRIKVRLPLSGEKG